tara:strand:+ start:754 stop:858 length:105 start_codon:yes stop_codon:yes gene_type:complete
MIGIAADKGVTLTADEVQRFISELMKMMSWMILS